MSLPPEWQPRPEWKVRRAAVWTPKRRHRWVRWALRRHVSEIDFVYSAEALAGSECDLALVSHDLLADTSRQLRWQIVGGDGEGPDEIRVVIDAPGRARVYYQAAGADIAIGPETTALELGSRIEALARRAAAERDRSPLTGLPGSICLRQRLRELLEKGTTVSLIMADIDDFKLYNDRHGHLAGDTLIRLLAEVLREAAEPHEAFLAHVGGDDFAVLSRPAEAEEFARGAEAEFIRRRTDLPGRQRPDVTIVGTTVSPEETDDLECAFERLAILRLRQREDKLNSQ